MGEFLGADGSPVLHLLGDLELPLQVFEPRLRDRRPRPGHRHRLLPDGEVRAQLAVSSSKSGSPAFTACPATTKTFATTPEQGRADGDVLGARLDQADGGDRAREARDGRRSRWLGGLPRG